MFFFLFCSSSSPHFFDSPFSWSAQEALGQLIRYVERLRWTEYNREIENPTYDNLDALLSNDSFGVGLLLSPSRCALICGGNATFLKEDVILAERCSFAEAGEFRVCLDLVTSYVRTREAEPVSESVKSPVSRKRPNRSRYSASS